MKLIRPIGIAESAIVLNLGAGMSASGVPVSSNSVSKLARVEDSSDTTFTQTGKKVKLSKKLFIFDTTSLSDINIEGTCTINSKEYNIVYANFFRHIDGSILYAEVGVSK